MKPTDLNTLEKDSKFKKKHLPRFFWIKSPAIYPPSSIIFIGILGLVYLLNSDMLISYYSIPFAILLALGAIWLKLTKRAVLKQMFSKENSFIVCFAGIVSYDDNWIYSIFTTSEKRHNKYYITHESKELADTEFEKSSYFNDIKSKISHTAVKLDGNNDIGLNEEMYIKAFNKKIVARKNNQWLENGYFKVLFIDTKNISLIEDII